MFNSDGSINPKYNSNKAKINMYRPNAPIEIQKIIDCHNKDLGCNAYECPNCGDVIFIGNTCKSRLCTSCGYKYKNERVENILQQAIKCKHRQIVFTIPIIQKNPENSRFYNYSINSSSNASIGSSSANWLAKSYSTF